MAEEVVFVDDTVSITTARVVISGTTYPLRNITSVKMSRTVKPEVPAIPPKHGCAISLIVLGAFMALGACSAFSEKVFIFAVPNMLISAAFIFGGVMWMQSAKPTPAIPSITDYHVTIATSSGDDHALTSRDINYIEKIVASINDAIVMAK